MGDRGTRHSRGAAWGLLAGPGGEHSPFSGPITTGPLLPGPASADGFQPEIPPESTVPAPSAADVPAFAPPGPVGIAHAALSAAGFADEPPATSPVAIDQHGSWSIEPSLRSRGPAYAVMAECLERQTRANARGRLARMLGHSPLHPEARSWYRGALGEIVVANVLSQLGSEWTVLHAVPVGSGASDIDHVILGPGGIFTINTKNHSGRKIWVGGGTFLVDGFKHDHMRNSLHEAERASRLLSRATGRPVTVTPLIVVVNPASITMGRKSPRVTVLPSSALKRWLVKRPRSLSDRAVAHFSMFAEERSTWHTAPVTRQDAPDRVARFERLRGEVDAARRRARLWLLALGGAAILVAPFAVGGVFRLLDAVLMIPGP